MSMQNLAFKIINTALPRCPALESEDSTHSIGDRNRWQSWCTNITPLIHSSTKISLGQYIGFLWISFGRKLLMWFFVFKFYKEFTTNPWCKFLQVQILQDFGQLLKSGLYPKSDCFPKEVASKRVFYFITMVYFISAVHSVVYSKGVVYSIRAVYSKSALEQWFTSTEWFTPKEGLLHTWIVYSKSVV